MGEEFALDLRIKALVLADLIGAAVEIVDPPDAPMEHQRMAIMANLAAAAELLRIELVASGYDDAEMAAAVQTARESGSRIAAQLIALQKAEPPDGR